MLGDSSRFAARIGALCIGIVLVLGAAIASADALRDGTDAFARKDTANAMRLLTPLAAAGDPIAGCMVAVMRDQKLGRVAYDADGMSATCIAAANGMAAAELDLAGNYRTGLILQKDETKAAQLYGLAAAHGLPVAQKVLGDLYAQGIGVGRDFATACRWWARAALQGQAEAQRNTGSCYLTGTGVPRSEMYALAWWLIARNHESQDHDGLPEWVFQSEADAERKTNALIQRLPAGQVIEAQALARGWRPQAE